MMTQFVHTITAIIAFFQKRCNCFCEFSEYFPSNGNIFPHLLDFAQIDEKIIVYFSGNLCYTVRAGAGKGRPGPNCRTAANQLKTKILQAFCPEKAIQGFFSARWLPAFHGFFTPTH
jgi:hypothetical protein